MLEVFIAFKSQRFSEKKRVFEPEHVEYMIVFLRLLSLISFYSPVYYTIKMINKPSNNHTLEEVDRTWSAR